MPDSTPPASRDVDVNGWPAVLSAIVLGTIGVLSFIIQPGIVQAYVTQLGLDEAGAVNLAGIEMLGVALATILVAIWGNRISWRTIVIGGLAVAALGDIASSIAPQGRWLDIARFFTGLGEGAITSISFTFVGLTIRAERNVALYLTLLLTYGAFGLWYLPTFLAAFGLAGLFGTFAVLSLAALVTVPFVPKAYDAQAMSNPEARQLAPAMLLVALLGVLTYNLAQGIAWAVLFLVGVGAGMAEQAVADALFLSQILAIGGALASVFLAGRVSRNGAIAFGILAGAGSIALLLGQPAPAVFTLGVCGFNVLWNFVLPFILGRVCDFDETGRMMSFAIAMQMVGLGLGPIIASHLLDGSGHRSAELLCIALFLASYLLLLMPMRRHRALMGQVRAPI
ncbi:MFS transporter [Novosphingobium piscinae]|uniref:MFS transporter n=1 Tax=Novosphingobium piscinae TaxID=1507448 RepID=A0A7X1G070_9SPHN|nr:MFS transporter [Novosphingobium piscinae]MBC2669562.1 MFS transporter [Novosphingobium piscinae]